MRTGTHLGASAAALAVTLSAAASVRAAPCGPLLAGMPSIVIEAGDTQEPLLKELGKRLASSATPMRILWISKSTCLLANDVYASTAIPAATVMKYTPTPTEDPAWTPAMDAKTCDADQSYPVDLGIAATFVSSCTNLPGKPASIGSFTGPIQGYGFVVPKGSSQTAMTAEEGYFAFGFPQGDGQAAPWTNAALRFVRGAATSTALTCSAAIGVPAARLRGTLSNPDRSSSVLNAVATSGLGANPEAVIGLLGVEIFDANRDKLKLLAFRGFGQRYAYYPDTTPTTFDKKNLRDGHYLPWAPTEYLATVDGAGVPTNADVKRFIDLVFGHRTDPDVDGLDAVIKKGLVPRCAMRVARPYDGAELSLYQDPEPCGCFYDATVPQGNTTCATCTNDTTCGTGKCRHGYCEAR